MHDINAELFPLLPGSFVQRMDAIHQINHFVVCLVNAFIHWIVIFLVDSSIYFFDNWAYK